MPCGDCCPVTASTQTATTVATSEVALLAANPNRKNAIIENQGATALSIYFTTGAGATAPFILPQYATWTAGQGAGVYQGAVYGIRASGSSLAGIVEET